MCRSTSCRASASAIISEVTGAEAGYVTAGAAAGLTLGAAACLAGLDLARMERLPDTDGLPNEIVVCREQRNGYDHALRAAGARLVEVGMNEHVAGAGVRRTETWEIEAAITDRTVAVAYAASPDSQPPLEEVAAACQRHGVPLIVDAAGAATAGEQPAALRRRWRRPGRLQRRQRPARTAEHRHPGRPARPDHVRRAAAPRP